MHHLRDYLLALGDLPLELVLFIFQSVLILLLLLFLLCDAHEALRLLAKDPDEALSEARRIRFQPDLVSANLLLEELFLLLGILFVLDYVLLLSRDRLLYITLFEALGCG